VYVFCSSIYGFSLPLWYIQTLLRKYLLNLSAVAISFQQVVRSSDRLLCEPPVCSIDITRTITWVVFVHWLFHLSICH